jgi:hypothetical protein
VWETTGETREREEELVALSGSESEGLSFDYPSQLETQRGVTGEGVQGDGFQYQSVDNL